MQVVLDNPIFVGLLSLVTLWLASWVGLRLTAVKARLDGAREDFRVVEGATLTLLVLIIGFTFSMASERYSQRKNLEEEEANAIGTEYVRADLLPAEAGANVRKLLISYLDQRILFYTTTDAKELNNINTRTAKLQGELWSAIVGPSKANPTNVMALVTSGMNDVLNSQGYTQAAWLNRIPQAAWIFLFIIATCSVLLVSVGGANARVDVYILPILPIVVSIAFFLIADIDGPRRGVIRVLPQNLLILADSLRTP